MARYIGISINWYGTDEEATPVVYLTAESTRDVPTKVDPYDDSDAAIDACRGLIQQMEGNRGMTVDQIAISLGGLTFDDGSPVPPSVTAPAPRSRRRPPPVARAEDGSPL